MKHLAAVEPVVAFDIGGNGELIDHKINGYLAQPYDEEDLANGIKWVLRLCKSKRIRGKCKK